MKADHISLRTSSDEVYRTKKKQLLEFGYYLSEDVMVNGRPITVVKLHKPLIGSGLEIDVLEISAPKQGKSYPDSLDHMEFVTDKNLEDLQKEYPDVDFELKGLQRQRNQDIEINFDDGTSVKFHNQTLENVVLRERKESVNMQWTFESIETDRLRLSYIKETDVQEIFDSLTPEVATYLWPQPT